jgi:hypothetical protein
MANAKRGEIEAVLDGKACTLCLTLGALAELEAAFGAGDLMALAERFAAQRLSARDLLRVIACGLRGGGLAVSDEEVARMKVEGGISAYARIAASLLAATFGEGDSANPP